MANLQDIKEWASFIIKYPIRALIIILVIFLLTSIALPYLSSYFSEKGKQGASLPPGVQPVLEIDINPQKILNIKSHATLKDINIFATKYLLNETSFRQKRIEIENYSKVGGSIKKIRSLRANRSIKIDLKNTILTFFENPGTNDNIAPILTYYCLRITYRNKNSGAKEVIYKVTSSYKDYPSFIDNQENTASAGTWGDFLTEIPKKIIDHQKKIYNED